MRDWGQIADGVGSGYSNYNSISASTSSSCSGVSGYSFSTGLADGDWHHVAITVDRNDPQGLRFYVDGECLGYLNPTGRQGNLDNGSSLYLGRNALGTYSFWQGTLDELAVHDAVLSPTTVAAIADRSGDGKCR